MLILRLLCSALVLLAVLPPDPPAVCARARGEEPLQGRICYTRQDGDTYVLHILDADGKNDRAIPNQPGKVNCMPAWSPDGKQIAFVSGDRPEAADRELYLIAPDGSSLRRLAEHEKIADQPAWSPDGKTLLCTIWRDRATTLLAITLDGGAMEELRTGLASTIASFFSPDGKRIGFTGAREVGDPNGISLFIANADGTNPERLTMGDSIAIGGPNAWSPDGRRIAFLAVDRQTMNATLRVWDLAEKIDQRLAEVKASPGSAIVPLPGWSPDGRWLVIAQAGEGEKSSLWRISADGKTQERFGPADASCHCPAWSRK